MSNNFFNNIYKKNEEEEKKQQNNMFSGQQNIFGQQNNPTNQLVPQAPQQTGSAYKSPFQLARENQANNTGTAFSPGFNTSAPSFGGPKQFTSGTFSATNPSTTSSFQSNLNQSSPFTNTSNSFTNTNSSFTNTNSSFTNTGNTSPFTNTSTTSPFTNTSTTSPFTNNSFTNTSVPFTNTSNSFTNAKSPFTNATGSYNTTTSPFTNATRPLSTTGNFNQSSQFTSTNTFPPQQPTTSSFTNTTSPFGSVNQTSTFGSTAQKTPIWGTSQPSTLPPQSTNFTSQQSSFPTQPTNFSPLTAQPSTNKVDYKKVSIRDSVGNMNYINHISAMDQYKNREADELRNEHYKTKSTIQPQQPQQPVQQTQQPIFNFNPQPQTPTVQPISIPQPAPIFNQIQQPQYFQPDLTDPYLSSKLSFKMIEPVTISNLNFPTKKLFDSKKPKEFGLNLSFQRTEEEIELPSKKLKIIENATVIWHGKFKVIFKEPIERENYTVQNIRRAFQVENKKLICKDYKGTGLNKAAHVYLYNIYPYMKSENVHIKKVTSVNEQIFVQRFEKHLKDIPDVIFISYSVDGGIYEYETKNLN